MTSSSSGSRRPSAPADGDVADNVANIEHGRYVDLMRGRTGLIAAGAVGAVVLALLPATSAHAATSITINGTGSGRRFDGVGAISGGGGTSRLLPDYPAQQQSEVLDYLFKPGFGANLQILKVEIGGGTNSTNGA